MLVIQQMAQGVPVAPSRQLPEGVTLRSLYEVANTTANRIIAESVDGYVFLVGVLEKDPIQLPSCFQTRRSSSDLDVNVSGTDRWILIQLMLLVFEMSVKKKKKKKKNSFLSFLIKHRLDKALNISPCSTNWI